MKGPIYVLFAISTALVCLTSRADSPKALQWHGFVAQGLIDAQNSNFVDDHGDISLKLTEIGINGSYRLGSRFRVAGQAVYLNGGNRYPEGIRADYLFFDWKAVASLDWQVNVHAGRVKNYHWMYSATRDVPHTRPTIILPQSIYFDSFRDVALGVDGLAVVANTSNSWGDWEYYWSYGSSPISREQTSNLVGQRFTGDFKQKFVQQFNTVWQRSNVRLGIGILDSDFEYTQGADDSFVDGDVSIKRLLIQASYAASNWQIAGELFRERTAYTDILFPNFFDDATAEGGYIQGRYLYSSDLTFTARLSLFDQNREDRDGRIREAATMGAIPAYFGFQDTFTLGLSWDPAPNWRTQLEFHRVKGTGRLAPVLIPNVEVNDQKYWNIWAAQLMYWF
ncbi:MAG: hypothetical protein Alis3KO_38550 [Aliiglaciecola sp.]